MNPIGDLVYLCFSDVAWGGSYSHKMSWQVLCVSWILKQR